MINELLKNKIINRLCERIVNITVPSKSKRHELRFWLREYLLDSLRDDLSKKYPDYYQFALFCPWGDFNIPCALFKSFKGKTNSKILAVCGTDFQEELLQKYSSIDKIIKINEKIYYQLFPDKLPQNYKQTLKKGRLYSLSHWLYSEAKNNKSMNFLELYTKMLGLNYPSKLCPPKLNFDGNSDYQNTILIYPETKSFTDKELSVSFWTNLADELSKMGYKVLFNTKEDKFANYETTFLPFIEQAEMAKQCAFVIGIRSGFSDFLSICSLKNHIVIYPKSMYFKTVTKEQQETEFKRAFVMEENKTFDENMYRITSLKMFNNLAKEVFYNTETQLTNEILEYIKGETNE